MKERFLKDEFLKKDYKAGRKYYTWARLGRDGKVNRTGAGHPEEARGAEFGRTWYTEDELTDDAILNILHGSVISKLGRDVIEPSDPTRVLGAVNECLDSIVIIDENYDIVKEDRVDVLRDAVLDSFTD